MLVMHTTSSSCTASHQKATRASFLALCVVPLWQIYTMRASNHMWLLVLLQLRHTCAHSGRQTRRENSEGKRQGGKQRAECIGNTRSHFSNPFLLPSSSLEPPFSCCCSHSLFCVFTGFFHAPGHMALRTKWQALQLLTVEFTEA